MEHSNALGRKVGIRAVQRALSWGGACTPPATRGGLGSEVEEVDNGSGSIQKPVFSGVGKWWKSCMASNMDSASGGWGLKDLGTSFNLLGTLFSHWYPMSNYTHVKNSRSYIKPSVGGQL